MKCVLDETEYGVQNLFNNMKNNSIKKDPACLDEGLYPKEFSEWQVNNFLSFLQFLESRRGKKIMQMLDDSCTLNSEFAFCDGNVEIEISLIKSIGENR